MTSGDVRLALLDRTRRVGAASRTRQRERELGADADLTLRRKLAAYPTGEVTTDREAEPDAIGLSRKPTVDLPNGSKIGPSCSGAMSPRVADMEPHSCAVDLAA